MAELASSMPTSGGLYYAAAVLAGPRYGPLAAWITGWSNWLVQVTGAPSVDYGCGRYSHPILRFFPSSKSKNPYDSALGKVKATMS